MVRSPLTGDLGCRPEVFAHFRPLCCLLQLELGSPLQSLVEPMANLLQFTLQRRENLVHVRCTVFVYAAIGAVAEDSQLVHDEARAPLGNLHESPAPDLLLLVARASLITSVIGRHI